MDERTTITLTMGQSAEALGLHVTFLGGTTVWYGGGEEPRGAVAIAFQHQGQSDAVSIVGQDAWQSEHEVFGFRYKILEPYQRDTKELTLAIERSIH
jgi:hypothetical protein